MWWWYLFTCSPVHRQLCCDIMCVCVCVSRSSLRGNCPKLCWDLEARWGRPSSRWAAAPPLSSPALWSHHVIKGSSGCSLTGQSASTVSNQSSAGSGLFGDSGDEQTPPLCWKASSNTAKIQWSFIDPCRRTNLMQRLKTDVVKSSSDTYGTYRETVYCHQ